MYVIVCVCANSDVIHALVPPTELSPEEICIFPLESPKALRSSIAASTMKSGRRRECQNSTLNVAWSRRRFIPRPPPGRSRVRARRRVARTDPPARRRSETRRGA